MESPLVIPIQKYVYLPFRAEEGEERGGGGGAGGEYSGIVE